MKKYFNAEHFQHMQSFEGKPLAGVLPRLIAFVIDFALVLLLYLVANFPFKGWKPFSGSDLNIKIDFDPFHDSAGLVFLLLYFGLGTYWGRGRTLGKWFLRIKVLSLSGKRITFWQSIERALGYGASMLEGGFGFIQVFWYQNRQTVHDRIAETIVVREK
jgi:uncharacterized RDD family membrane protein YckC